MKINELKKFAITLALLPWIPAYILYKHSFYKAAITVLCVFLPLSIICFISKTFAAKLKEFLDKTGGFIGRYLAVIILFFVYFIAVVPTGLLMKIVKRDRLRLKKQKIQSYWLNNENKTSDYEYQF